MLLSVNTSLDRILVVPEFVSNTVNRVDEERWVGGGKSLNVVKMMERIGTLASAVVVVGKERGGMSQPM